MPNSYDPATALDEIQQAQAAVRRRVGGGSWLHDILYGACVAGAVGGFALDNPERVAVVSFSGLGASLLMSWNARRLGVKVDRFRPRTARWVFIALVADVLVLIGALLAVKAWADPGLLTAGALGATALAFVSALVASRVWLSLYRAEQD